MTSDQLEMKWSSISNLGTTPTDPFLSAQSGRSLPGSRP